MLVTVQCFVLRQKQPHACGWSVVLGKATMSVSTLRASVASLISGVSGPVIVRLSEVERFLCVAVCALWVHRKENSKRVQQTFKRWQRKTELVSLKGHWTRMKGLRVVIRSANTESPSASHLNVFGLNFPIFMRKAQVRVHACKWAHAQVYVRTYVYACTHVHTGVFCIIRCSPVLSLFLLQWFTDNLLWLELWWEHSGSQKPLTLESSQCDRRENREAGN